MYKHNPFTISLCMNALYRIEATANAVTVRSLVTGALMARYSVSENVRARDAFYKVPDTVRDVALRARWLCQAQDSRAETREEIRVIEVEGKGAWEARFGESLHPSYLGVLKTQDKRLTHEIQTAETAQSAALKG